MDGGLQNPSFYSLSDAVAQISLFSGIQISEVLAHPSGEYLVGTGQDKDRNPFLVRISDDRMEVFKTIDK